MSVYRSEHTCQSQKELFILMRLFAWIQKIDAVICCQGPVVMLTGTIDTFKWFLMKQTLQVMFTSHSFQCLHDQLIVVNCHVLSHLS